MIKSISILEVMDDLLDNPLLSKLTLERVVNYAIVFMLKVGVPKLYTDKIVHLELDEYRCMLPCDFYEMIQVRDGYGHTYRSTTDTFHLDHHKCDGMPIELTYLLLNNVLYSNVKDGLIELSYRAFELDENGFPLIPDNGTYKEALELYIEKKEFRKLFLLGKLDIRILLETNKEYAWAVGLATTDLLRPSLDEMESITNTWNLALVRNNEHMTTYKYLGTKEFIKRH